MDDSAKLQEFEQQLAAVQQKFAAYLETRLLTKLERELDRQIAYLDSITEIWRRSYPEGEVSPGIPHHKAWQKISDRMHKAAREAADPRFQSWFEGFSGEISRMGEEIPENIVVEQSPDRFKAAASDPWETAFGKKIKSVGFALSRLPLRTANVFRKEPRPVTYWRQTIPARDYFQWHAWSIVDTLTAVASEIWIESAAATQKLAQSILQADAKRQAASEAELAAPGDRTPYAWEPAIAYREQLVQFKTEMSDRLQQAFRQVFVNIREGLLLAGTFELPARHISREKRLAAINDYEATFELQMRQSHEAVRQERMRFAYDAWLSRFQTLAIRWLINLHQRALPAFFLPLDDWAQDASRVISERQKELEGLEIETLMKTIRQMRPGFRKALSAGAVEPARSHLASTNFPAALGTLGEQISTTVRKFDLLFEIDWEDKGLEEVRLDKIVPEEYATSMGIPSDELKGNFVQKTVELRKMYGEVLQISMYNLDVTEDAVETNYESGEGILKMTSEGFARALEKVKDCSKVSQDLKAALQAGAREGVANFRAHLAALRERDGVLASRQRIRRNEFSSSGKALGNQSRALVTGAAKTGAKGFASINQWLYESFEGVRVKLGLSAPPAVIGAEVSEFLNETEREIRKLPFVYQRLFALEPVDEAVFFALREAELGRMETAYESWRGKNHTAVAVTGAQKGGKTSLLNHFAGQLGKSPHLFRLEPEDRVTRPEQLAALFAKCLGWEEVPEAGKLAEKINAAPRPMIIFIDPVESFYLRKVGGLAALRFLLELISSTVRNVFWVCAVSRESWNYLGKVSSMADHFSHIIDLPEISGEDLEEIIWKRHAFSGYQLVFMPGKSNLQNNAFRRMSEPQKQETLRKDYFEQLKKLSGENLSVAFLFWLRSVAQGAENSLKVHSLDTIDLNFLDILSVRKWITLHSLIQHDGLSLAEYAEIFRIPTAGARLALLALTDDGIVVVRGGKYYVNPLLLHYCIRQLKSKNFIH